MSIRHRLNKLTGVFGNIIEEIMQNVVRQDIVTDVTEVFHILLQH